MIIVLKNDRSLCKSNGEIKETEPKDMELDVSEKTLLYVNLYKLLKYSRENPETLR